MDSVSSIGCASILSAVLLLYFRGRHRMKMTAANTPAPWRVLCFACGILLASTFWVTPLAHLGHQSLTGHMIQHLLLMTVAAPLVLLGKPVLTLWPILPHWIGNPEYKFPNQGSVDSETQSSARLVLCWMAGTATVIWWHIPAVFAFSMRSAQGHEIEKITFFLGGLFFWGPVLREWPDREGTPHWSIVLYLFLATLPCDVLSAFLTFCGRLVYGFYASGPETMQHAALRDQERAGALMWTWVTFAYLTPAVLIAMAKLTGSAALGSRGRRQ